MMAEKILMVSNPQQPPPKTAEQASNQRAPTAGRGSRSSMSRGALPDPGSPFSRVGSPDIGMLEVEELMECSADPFKRNPTPFSRGGRSPSPFPADPGLPAFSIPLPAHSVKKQRAEPAMPEHRLR